MELENQAMWKKKEVKNFFHIQKHDFDMYSDAASVLS